MAGSRLEKLGTIFTRMNGLIKSGAIKIDDRPIWYDVYRAFPPESEPHFARPALQVKVPDIFFQEDIFRADFHKKIRGQLPPIDLKETQSTQNVTKIAVDMAAANQSLSVDQVVETLKKNGALPTINTSSKQYDSSKNTYRTDRSNINTISEPKVQNHS